MVGWLFLIFIHQLLNYLVYTGDIYQYPHLIGIEFPMPVLHGVLLYFYVMEITGNRPKNSWASLLHLTPTLSLIILAIPFYLLSGEEKTYVFQHDGAGYEWYVIYMNILIPLSSLIYSIWSLILIKKHRLKIQDNFSIPIKKTYSGFDIFLLGMV